VAQLEGRRRAAGGNALRDAVLGADDDLVSNLSLVMGVAGAELNNATILTMGLAGLNSPQFVRLFQGRTPFSLGLTVL
jgi:VIT1/CCC1 family predicted Fe2+/Mn2+ transporter